MMSEAKANTDFNNAKSMNRIDKKQTPNTGMRAANPTLRSSSSASSLQESMISGALGIINSPGPKQRVSMRRGSLASVASSVGRRGSSVSQRRGSLLCERRSSELLADNADRLSGLMLNCKQAMADLDCDYESDFDE